MKMREIIKRSEKIFNELNKSI